MRCLAMIAHGSRNPKAKQELIVLAKETHQALGTHYDKVGACYLELASPSLTQLSHEWINDSALHIDIYPLFLNSGKHTSKDIPEEVEALRKQYPSITFKLLPYLGQNPHFATIVSEHIQNNIG